MRSLDSILVVQTKQILDEQRDQIDSFLTERLDAEVSFASSPDGVVPGTRHDAVIAPTIAWLPQVLERIDGLRWVHFLSAGVERIWDMDVDWSRYVLTKSSGVHAIPMSEYAIGAMLHFAKSFDRFIAQSQERKWERIWLDELSGRNLLVIGMGAVGSAVAERARALGMEVQGVARSGRTDTDGRVIHSFVDLYGLLSDADYVVVTVPLTEQTRHLVGESFFTNLKQGAVLVDMSRGGVVSSTALLKALNSGTLRGAALDVFEAEPLPTDSEFWNRANVLLTPHVAGTTPLYTERALDVFLGNAQAFVGGETMPTAVVIDRRY